MKKWEDNMTSCGICTEVEEVKHITLYITGSEGLDICNGCEMRLVSYIRDMKSLVAKTKLLGVKIGRRDI